MSTIIDLTAKWSVFNEDIKKAIEKQGYSHITKLDEDKDGKYLLMRNIMGREVCYKVNKVPNDYKQIELQNNELVIINELRMKDVELKIEDIIIAKSDNKRLLLIAQINILDDSRNKYIIIKDNNEDYKTNSISLAIDEYNKKLKEV